MEVTHIPPNDPGACCGPVHSYTQCRMTRRVDGKQSNQIAWIPTEFASLGAEVRIRVDGVWEDGWRVQSLGATKPGRDDEPGVTCECGAE